MEVIIKSTVVMVIYKYMETGIIGSKYSIKNGYDSTVKDRVEFQGSRGVTHWGF